MSQKILNKIQVHKLKYMHHLTLCVIVTFFLGINSFSQDSSSCKVAMETLKGFYKGDCKNGFAHGKGEAKGINSYVGNFKYGLPNGKGTYFYNNSVYFEGNFQDGVKEGKGETHYRREGMADSIVKGYWSADEFKGKSYKTYNIIDIPSFDRVDITPSDESGNTLTIEIAMATSGASDQYTGNANVLSVSDVIAKDGGQTRKLETVSNPSKSSATYEISKFPARLQIVLSNTRSINLELFKTAKWRIQIFINK